MMIKAIDNMSNFWRLLCLCFWLKQEKAELQLSMVPEAVGNLNL